MKKLFSLALALILGLCMFTACEEPGTPPAHTHTWSEWETVTAATCEQKGLEKRSCSCSETEERETAKAHVFDVNNRCKVCGLKETDPSKFIFTQSGDGYSVQKYIGTATEVVIPHSYNGKPVVEIADSAFRGCKDLFSVRIADSVTSIGLYAFGDCTSLAEVSFAEDGSLTNIGEGAFRGCSALVGIELPSSVKNIGYWAFAYSTSLKSVTIPDNVITIGGFIFSYCSGLESVTISNGVTTISNYAFAYCTNLANVEIPDSVKTVGNYAFAGCTAISSIAIPSSVNSIGEYAFSDCTGLTSMEIPSSVKSVGYRAFQGCTGIIETENGLSYVDKWVIEGDKSAKSVVLRSGTIGIGSCAFFYCRSLKSVAFPEGLTSISDSAFSGCLALTNIEFPASLTNIGEQAFSGCENLASLEIPASMTRIDRYAFSGCLGLQSVTFANQSGWTVTRTKNAPFGLDVTLSDPTQNDNYFTSIYNGYYWYRK